MQVSVKVTSRPRIEVPQLSVGDMQAVGGRAEQVIEHRVDSSTPRDVHGSSAPPLSMNYRERYRNGRLESLGSDRGYRSRKIKAGARPVRDLRLTGELWEDMAAYQAKKGYVYVGFKSSEQYLKAFKQQKKFEWFGLSDQEEHIVVEHANELYAQRAQAIGAGRSGIT